VLTAGLASAQPADRPIKWVLNVGLQMLDPIAGPSFVTRNPAYVPRDELVDGVSGGKVPRAEQVEFINMADPGLRAAALQNNEVDYLEYAPRSWAP